MKSISGRNGDRSEANYLHLKKLDMPAIANSMLRGKAIFFGMNEFALAGEISKYF
jgi:hypothetical protein